MSGQERQYDKHLNVPGAGNRDLHDLVRDCIAKDRQAQKKLYDRYSGMIYGVIRRYIYSDAPAQEILNDSFFKIFTKLESFAFAGSFEGWMRRITVNTITDYLRKNIRHEQMMKADPADHEIGVADDAASKIAYKDLLKMIHELPQTQRAVFNLFVFEQYSHKEIGEQLDITENNCRWYLNDARKRLKEKINSAL